MDDAEGQAVPDFDWVSPGWRRSFPDAESQGSIVSDLESLQRRFGDDFIYLLALLNRADPAGLIATGCPPDEYTPEAEGIFEGLPDVSSPEALQDLMYGIFVQMLSADHVGSRSQYEEAARALWQRRKGRESS